MSTAVGRTSAVFAKSHNNLCHCVPRDVTKFRVPRSASVFTFGVFPVYRVTVDACQILVTMNGARATRRVVETLDNNGERLDARPFDRALLEDTSAPSCRLSNAYTRHEMEQSLVPGRAYIKSVREL